MLRNTISILLLIAFTVQSFSKVFLVINYHANKAAFVKSCVNKAVPKMNCNGQCVLMKKIEAQETKEQKNTELKLENKNDVYFVSNFLHYPHSLRQFLTYPAAQSIVITADFCSYVFRPPLS